MQKYSQDDKWPFDLERKLYWLEQYKKDQDEKEIRRQYQESDS